MHPFFYSRIRPPAPLDGVSFDSLATWSASDRQEHYQSHIDNCRRKDSRFLVVLLGATGLAAVSVNSLRQPEIWNQHFSLHGEDPDYTLVPRYAMQEFTDAFSGFQFSRREGEPGLQVWELIPSNADEKGQSLYRLVTDPARAGQAVTSYIDDMDKVTEKARTMLTPAIRGTVVSFATHRGVAALQPFLCRPFRQDGDPAVYAYMGLNQGGTLSTLPEIHAEFRETTHILQTPLDLTADTHARSGWRKLLEDSGMRDKAAAGFIGLNLCLDLSLGPTIGGFYARRRTEKMEATIQNHLAAHTR